MPEVILVDEQDQEIGQMEKLAAHKQGLLHRAFSIFIFSNDEQPRLLLQQRADGKYHGGGLWTNTCCSHPVANQSLQEVAEQRLQFEMGIQADLHPVGHFIYRAEFENGLIEHEFDHVLVGFMDREHTVRINKEEAKDYQWIALDAVEEWYADCPHLFSPWFFQAYQIALQG